MQIWQKATGLGRNHPTLAAPEQSPIMQELAGRGVRLELVGRYVAWTVELSREDCERIAEAIDRPRPAQWPFPVEE